MSSRVDPAAARGILEQVLAIPSVPFHEQGIVDYARAWSERTGVPLRQDRAGNVYLEYRRGRRRARSWVFAAHMDHPGFVATRRAGTNVWGRFRGSVWNEYGPGERVRWFAPGGEVTAVVETRRPVPAGDGWTCRTRLARPANVPPGTIGMWDFPAVRVRGRRLASRGCDDLVGSACVLSALDALHRRRAHTHVLGLLTRAEEVGALGAAAACIDGEIPARARVIGIETSKAQAAARLGDGVVIRVGDNVLTFSPELTAAITVVAKGLAQRDESFRFVRQLMPGGMCESTLYCAWGLDAAAICLPLGNYHNMGPRGRIGPERIDLDDYQCTVTLLVALAEATAGKDGKGSSGDVYKAVRARFTSRLQTRGDALWE